MKRLIPADTVDAEGTVWETVGENIRRGTKEFSENRMKAIVDILFPVGSVYCGENSFITSVGKWKLIEEGNSAPLILVYETVTGDLAYTKFTGATLETDNPAIGLRLWKRVS